MKTVHTLIIAGAIIIAGALAGLAQSYGGFTFGPIAPAVANCPIGQANYATLCSVGTSPTSYATYVSYNLGAYQPLIPPPAPVGVTSFNKRTGDIQLTDLDVQQAGVKVSTTVTAVSTVQ
jgi:hypothetical protein